MVMIMAKQVSDWLYLTMLDVKSLKQLFLYGIIGFAHNFLAYLVYLLVTWQGANPKLVISVTYPVFATFSYFANKHWTFSHQGEYRRSIFRYCIAHVMGYGINLLMLYYF